MKTLQKEVQILYRFRCDKCRSQFEMTEEEKIENDWKFSNYEFSRKENRWICGPLDRFDCPICNAVSYVRRNDMHRFHVMDDGTEIKDY